MPKDFNLHFYDGLARNDLKYSYWLSLLGDPPIILMKDPLLIPSYATTGNRSVLGPGDQVTKMVLPFSGKPVKQCPFGPAS